MKSIHVVAGRSERAIQIKSLVDKAAALVKGKGKEAFAEFRKEGGGGFEGTRTSLLMT